MTLAIDQLIQKCTAFGSLAHLLESVERGYIPSIPQRSDDQKELTNLLVALGVKVFIPETGTIVGV